MFQVHGLQENSTYILSLDGILDISTIDILDHLEIMKMNNWHSLDTIILDFSNLQLIDSTGINAILRLAQLFRSKGLRVRLDGMNDTINNILETVGVLRILEAHKEEA